MYFFVFSHLDENFTKHMSSTFGALLSKKILILVEITVLKKLQNVVLIVCDSRGGKAGSQDEEFRISHAYLLSEIKSSSDLLGANILSCTFSMSQSVPRYYPREKNRSDKYRISLPKEQGAQYRKLTEVWGKVVRLV